MRIDDLVDGCCTSVVLPLVVPVKYTLDLNWRGWEAFNVMLYRLGVVLLASLLGL